jgi:hypothetical protein
MKPTTVTTSGVSTSSLIVPDYLISPFNIGLGVVVTGTATYTVQHTFDDPFASGFLASSATWFDHKDLVDQTTSEDGNYAFPVRAIRVNQTAGTGSTAMTVVQAG